MNNNELIEKMSLEAWEFAIDAEVNEENRKGRKLTPFEVRLVVESTVNDLLYSRYKGTELESLIEDAVDLTVKDYLAECDFSWMDEDDNLKLVNSWRDEEFEDIFEAQHYFDIDIDDFDDISENRLSELKNMLENIKSCKNWHQMLDAVNEYEKVFGNETSWKLKKIID